MACIVGLTGGIATGKTEAIKLFQTLGIDTVESDQVAHHLVKKSPDLQRHIIHYFGNQFLDEQGHINRSQLRHHIFRHEKDRRWLESLLHPLVHREEKKLLKKAKSSYTLLCSALLLKSKQQSKLCRYVIVIDCLPSQQIKRSLHRDQEQEKYIRDIMRVQPTRKYLLKKADFLIDNSRNRQHLKEQVIKVHGQLMNLLARS